ncbi:MAG: toprim domain-containing protein, partial [Nitrospinota bacterium]
PQKAMAAGLVRPRSERGGHYDVFRERIVFPIRGRDGRVAGFGGRTFGGGTEDKGEDPAPKYLNSPDTSAFKKHQILYGFHEAKEEIRRGRTALLVEGYFDVIALHQHGIQNAVASLGTALSPEHVRLLRRDGFCETLVLCFDPDAAGEGAARRGGTMLLERYRQSAMPERWRGGQELTTLLGKGGGDGGDWNRMAFQVVALPSGEDADSYVRSRGAESFRGLLEKAENLIDYLLNRVLAACPPDSPIERRMEALREMGEILSGQSEAVRREYVRVVGERLRIDEDLAQRALRTTRRRAEEVRATVDVRARTEKSPPAERVLVQLLLRHPELGGRLDLPLERFSDARMRRLAEAAVKHAAAGEGEFVPAVIEAVGDPAAGDWVTELSMEPCEWEDPERAARDCVARILEAALRRRKESWQSRMDEAKRRGDPKEIQALLDEGEALRKEKVGLLQGLVRAEGFMEASSAG